MFSSKKHLSILLLLIFTTSCNGGAINSEIKENPSKVDAPVLIAEKPDSVSPPTDIIRPNEGPNTIGTKPVPDPIYTNPATATQSTKPVNDTGTTSDIKERATFNGKVYDQNNNPVDGETVIAKCVDAGVNWIEEATQTSNGAYVFRNAPVGARIEITVTKDGWTSRTRSEVLKSNLNGDPKANTFDFGFDGSSSSTDANALYAIQDAPEVISLKINGKLANDTASGVANKTESSGNADVDINGAILTPATTGVETDNLIVEMSFSEAVNKEDVQNYFRVVSSVGTSINNKGSFKGALINQKSIVIDKTYPTVTFDWSADSRNVTIKTNKGILSNSDSSDTEAKYLIDFSNPIRDLTSVKSEPKRTFRFTDSRLGGFHSFSVKNQNQAPYITDFYAVNGTSGSDYLKIKFNMPMDVIGRTTLASILSDPKVSTPVVANNLESISNANSTLLGYHDINSNSFVPVYQVAIMKPLRITTSSSLNITNGRGGSGSNLIKSAIVDPTNPNIIIIELPQDAFNANDKIIISAGGQLSGMYNGSKTNNFSSLDLKTGIPLPSSNAFAELTDPSGKILDRSNVSISSDFSTSNAQKIATAG